MQIFKTNKKIRNEFFYQTIYELFYPAVLGTILVYIVRDVLSGDLVHKGIFAIMTLTCLVWYFVLDFYVGFTNFKGDEESYDFRYLILDIIFIITAFSTYYGLWLSDVDLDFLFFISCTIITGLLILLDHFDAKDAYPETKFNINSFYCISLLILGILSVGMTIVSLALSKSLFYLITKYSFISLIVIILILYSLYILSDESFRYKKNSG